MRLLTTLVVLIASSAYAGGSKISCKASNGKVYNLTKRSLKNGKYREFFKNCKRQMRDETACYRGSKNQLSKILQKIDASNIYGKGHDFVVATQYRGTFSFNIRRRYKDVRWVSSPICILPDPFACAQKKEVDVDETLVFRLKRCR